MEFELKPNRRVGQYPGIQAGPFVPYLVACLCGLIVGSLYLVSPWLALGVILGGAICLVVLTKPVIACYFMVAFIALASGVERGRLVPFLRLNEAGLLLFTSLVFLISLVNKRRHLARMSYELLAFILLIAGTTFIPWIAYQIRGIGLTVEDGFVLFAPLQYLILFWMFSYCAENESDRSKLILWMLICSALVAIVGLMQAAGIEGIRHFLASWYASGHMQESAQVGRVTSLLGAWNALGIFLMVNFLIGWAVIPSLPGRLKALVIVVMALSVVCLIATGSFAGAIGLILGVLILEIVLRRFKRIAPGLLVFVVAILVAFLLFYPIIQPLVDQRISYQFRNGGIVPQTLAFRFQVWREIYWPAILQNPLWGVYLTPPASYSWRFAESQYLMLLFRFGLPGLLAHLAWVVITLFWLYKQLSQRQNFGKALVGSALAILIVLSVAGFTNAVFTYSGVADYLWILLALASHREEA